MDTMIIQLTNHKAERLLRDLEELHIIKVLKTNVQTAQKLSDKYAGKLPSDIAEQLQDYTQQSREQWNNDAI